MFYDFFIASEPGFFIWAAILILFLILFFLLHRVMSFYNKHKLELRRLSQSCIRDIDQMNRIDFEHYLALLFKKLGYRVKRTPSSNDSGADLILEGKERIVVQTKKFKNKVGIETVQEINSARDDYKAQKAWIITNNFFTAQAIKLAESTDIELIDRYELFDLILKYKYYHTTSLDNDFRTYHH